MHLQSKVKKGVVVDAAVKVYAIFSTFIFSTLREERKKLNISLNTHIYVDLLIIRK